MSRIESELKALDIHASAYETSIQKLEAEGGDLETIALETRNLKEIHSRIDELKKVKGASSGSPSSIPRVQ